MRFYAERQGNNDGTTTTTIREKKTIITGLEMKHRLREVQIQSCVILQYPKEV